MRGAAARRRGRRSPGALGAQPGQAGQIALGRVADSPGARPYWPTSHPLFRCRPGGGMLEAMPPQIEGQRRRCGKGQS